MRKNELAQANYTIAQWDGPGRLYVSGPLPIKLDGSMITGPVGPEDGGLSLEDAQEAARWCGLGLIATIQDQLGGDLDRVEKVVKLFGIVASKQTFKSQHLVLNGASDVMMEVSAQPTLTRARAALTRGPLTHVHTPPSHAASVHD